MEVPTVTVVSPREAPETGIHSSWERLLPAHLHSAIELLVICKRRRPSSTSAAPPRRTRPGCVSGGGPRAATDQRARMPPGPLTAVAIAVDSRGEQSAASYFPARPHFVAALLCP